MNKYQKALWNITQNLNDNIPTDNYEQDLNILQWLVDNATPMRLKKAKRLIRKLDYRDFEGIQYVFGYYVWPSYYVCPNCSSTLYEDTEELKINDFQDNYNQDIKYCRCCGQALDWNEDNNETCE